MGMGRLKASPFPLLIPHSKEKKTNYLFVGGWGRASLGIEKDGPRGLYLQAKLTWEVPDLDLDLFKKALFITRGDPPVPEDVVSITCVHD